VFNATHRNRNCRSREDHEIGVKGGKGGWGLSPASFKTRRKLVCRAAVSCKELGLQGGSRHKKLAIRPNGEAEKPNDHLPLLLAQGGDRPINLAEEDSNSTAERDAI